MHADVILVGGGLAGGLLAYRLSLQHPEKRILLLEASACLGGNHVWIFHESDVQGAEWLRPLISKSWPQFEVRFPKRKQTRTAALHAIDSSYFNKILGEKLGAATRFRSQVEMMTSTSVRLATGEVLYAPLIIDATGIAESALSKKTFADSQCGWRKSLSFELLLQAPHGMNTPIAADAAVPQMDGYRYFTCLPLAEKRVWIKESFYSANPDLNRERLKQSILAYADRLGWKIASIEREESTAIPLPLYQPNFDVLTADAFLASGEDFDLNTPVAIGAGHGWFNLATGDELPDAVRIAEFIASLAELRTGAVRPKLRDYRAALNELILFYRLLNRLMFRAAEPSLRYQIFENLFSLPEDMVDRFNAGLLTARDRSRILSSIPVLRADRTTKYWKEKPSGKPTEESATKPTDKPTDKLAEKSPPLRTGE